MKNGGLLLQSFTVVCEVSQTSWQMGKHRRPVKAPSIGLNVLYLEYSLDHCMQEESQTEELVHVWTRQKSIVEDSIRRK